VNLTSASGSSVTLSIHTTPRPVITTAASIFTRRFYAIWLMIPGMALVGIGGKRRRRRILGILTLCTLVTLLLLVPACSSSKTQTPVSGTPAGNYTITVTAAAGTDSKSQTIGLSVP
jgi:peptidoglycan/LPS O-acetylase OafA/YrhL